MSYNKMMKKFVNMIYISKQREGKTQYEVLLCAIIFLNRKH